MPRKKIEKNKEKLKEKNGEIEIKKNIPVKSIEKRKIQEEEFEKRILELSKEGITAEKIGEKMRREGIHPKEHRQKISRILKKHNLWENPDYKNILEKLEKIKEHNKKNPQDKRSMREKERIFSEKRKIEIYNSKRK